MKGRDTKKPFVMRKENGMYCKRNDRVVTEGVNSSTERATVAQLQIRGRVKQVRRSMPWGKKEEAKLSSSEVKTARKIRTGSTGFKNHSKEGLNKEEI